MEPDGDTGDFVAPMRSVAGKVAFITGGVSGIGLGIARAMLNAGMKVVITYQSPHHLDEAVKVLRNAAERVHAIKLDVTNRAAVASAAAETVRVFGKIHVLVNNAGVGPIVPLSSATFDDWDWCMSVNVNGVFNGVHAFLPHIKAHGEGGQIVATSSMLGGLVVGPFWGVYSTTKFAVVGMMEALRSELSNTNIGVSVFCPAGVNTNLGSGNRNRPSALAETGASNPDASALMMNFGKSVAKVREDNPDSPPTLDPFEVGELVLDGIRNNDLYILSHPEYESFIRERNDALLASIPKNLPPPSSGRLALTELVRTPIYAAERNRRLAARHRSA
jgi:NAD(P)-dependent dehydrogenase (short-subunit alcohol dehydrogenase family)